MVLKLLESFDDDLWDERITGTATTGASYGLHGDGIRAGATPGTYFYVPVDPANGTAILGFALKVVNSGEGDRALSRQFGSSSVELWYDSTNQRLHMQVQTGSVSYYHQYTAVGSVPLNKWVYVEIKWYHNTGSAGTMQIGVNGVYQTEGTGIDYFSGFSSLRFGWTLITDVADFYMDDIYVADTTGGVNDDLLGPLVVNSYLPNGNGNSSDLVGSDGNSTDNYLLVDESPPDDGTTYVESGTQGDKDTYAIANVSGTPTIVGVMPTAYAQRTQTGVKFLRHVTRVSSTDYVGSDLGLSEDYTPVEEAWDENPNTSTAWTATTLNAAEFGVEVRD